MMKKLLTTIMLAACLALSALADTVTLENRSDENLPVQVVNDDGAVIHESILPPYGTLVFSDDSYLGFYFGNGAVYHTDYFGVNVIARYYDATAHSIEAVEPVDRRVEVVLEFSEDGGVTWDGCWQAETSIVQSDVLPLPGAALTVTDNGDGTSDGHITVGAEAFDVLLSTEFRENLRFRAATRYQP